MTFAGGVWCSRCLVCLVLDLVPDSTMDFVSKMSGTRYPVRAKYRLDGQIRPRHTVHVQTMRPESYTPKYIYIFFVAKSFYRPKGSNFSSWSRRCFGGPSGVHTAAPTCTYMLGIGAW
jgi:hypothetical protein